MNSPSPALHRDLDAAHKRGIALKFLCYHQRRNAQIVALRREVAITLILLTVLAVAVTWLFQSLP